jgi:hypothetical protein
LPFFLGINLSKKNTIKTIRPKGKYKFREAAKSSLSKKTLNISQMYITTQNFRNLHKMSVMLPQPGSWHDCHAGTKAVDDKY